jgi:hypothetical protein
MRVGILGAMALLLATPAAMLSAQTAAAPAAAPPAAAPPIRSTLKPPPAPGADTSQPRQRMVTVFGTEPCPKPTSSDEIVVCARLPESEIYRIPERLRQAENRQSVFASNRNLLLGDSSGGAGGAIGSCTTIGGGGSIGCTKKDIDAWASDRTDRMGYNEPTPPQ